MRQSLDPVIQLGAGCSSLSSKWTYVDEALHRQRYDCRDSRGPCRTKQGYLPILPASRAVTRGLSKDDRGLPVRVCPSSIVSVSSLLRSIATCSWHFPFFEYVVIAVQYLRTSHGIHVHKQSCCCAITVH